MNIIKLAAAAALLVSSLAVSAAPAEAQRGRGNDRWEQNDNGRHNARGDRGRRDGWRGNNRRNRVQRHRVCRTVWRHHQRQRVCTWRYSRYRR